MTSQKHQGVISGVVEFNNVEYLEIFDKNFKYLYGENYDLFVAYGTWVEYNVVDAPKNHPKNCLFLACNVNYVDVKISRAPTTDEFRSNDMNVRDYNKVDFFQYDNGDGILTHKSTVQRDPQRRNQFYNNYYGDVNITQDAHRRLLEHRIDKLDVMMNLIPSDKYTSGPHWEVTHFINQGKCYSINGYLSITGHVLRGPGGVVRNRSEVTVAPDALRPKNLGRTFGNSPVGNRGLGGLARSAFGSPSPGNSASPTRNQPDNGFGGFKTERNDGFAQRNETRNPFNQASDDISEKASKLSLDTTNSTNSTFGRGFGNTKKAYGGSGGSGKPTGLGRLTNAHF